MKRENFGPKYISEGWKRAAKLHRPIRLFVPEHTRRGNASNDWQKGMHKLNKSQVTAGGYWYS